MKVSATAIPEIEAPVAACQCTKELCRDKPAPRLAVSESLHAAVPAMLEVPSLLQNIARGGVCGVLDSAKYVQGELLRQHGFARRAVDTRVGKVQILEAGGLRDGPTYIFLHGFASEGTDFGPLLRRWRGHCGRIVALDLPGHGRTPCPVGGINAQVLTSACEDVFGNCLKHDERCVVVGNSMGGLGAVRMAQRFKQVAGLVLMSPAGAPMSTAEMNALVRSFKITSFGEALAFVDKLFINGNRLRHVYAAAVWAHINRPHFQALLQAYRHEPPLNGQDLTGLPPTLLIWGDGDNFLPKSGRTFFCNALPADRTTVITHGHFSHSPYLDKAEDVCAEMVRWQPRVVGAR